jgi:hypothetical protein
MMMADVEEVVLEQLAATPRARVQQVHVGNGELLPGLDRAESPELDLSGTAWWRGAFLSVGRGVFVGSWAGRCGQLSEATALLTVLPAKSCTQLGVPTRARHGEDRMARDQS